jgi:probable rRNA maturation factor
LGIEGDVNLLLVDDRRIRKINRRFLNHDYATDVIAFEMREREIFGDIVVSTETAKSQAAEQGHSLLKETTILAVHGLLHLIGYRDKKKKDRERMWRKTNELLRLVSDPASRGTALATARRGS